MSGERPAHLAGVLLRHAENGLAWPGETASSQSRPCRRTAGSGPHHAPARSWRGFEISRPGPESRHPACRSRMT